MSRHLGLVVARMHGVLVARPGSDVFHVYSGPLSPSGRFVPRAARAVCSARTRQLIVLPRDGATVDVHGRRMCARCSARLFAIARRAEQPPVNRDAAIAYYRGITLADLVTAITLAETVDESHRIGFVLGLLFPAPPARRPIEFSGRQALFDVHAELLRRRTQMRAAERSPEEVEAAAMKREADAMRDAQILAARRKSDAIDKAIDRRNNGGYLLPHERRLLDTA